MRILLALALTSGCLTPEELVVEVRTAAGKPVAEALVACTCEPGASAAAMTDDGGVAILAIFETDHEPCVVTVAAAGHPTQQIAGVEPCPPDTTCPPLAVELP